jgi:hypothetical protein
MCCYFALCNMLCDNGCWRTQQQWNEQGHLQLQGCWPLICVIRTVTLCCFGKLWLASSSACVRQCLASTTQVFASRQQYGCAEFASRSCVCVVCANCMILLLQHVTNAVGTQLCSSWQLG